jgi:hypothetical protein
MDVARHIKKYPGCGIDPWNFSDLKAFRRRTEELKNEAAGTEVVENLEDVEETAQSPDPASFQCGCSWGSIVKKYNAMTTNHYINWLKPLNCTADVPNMVRQVKSFFFTFFILDVGLLETFTSFPSFLFLLVVDCDTRDDE